MCCDWNSLKGSHEQLLLDIHGHSRKPVALEWFLDKTSSPKILCTARPLLWCDRNIAGIAGFVVSFDSYIADARR